MILSSPSRSAGDGRGASASAVSVLAIRASWRPSEMSRRQLLDRGSLGIGSGPNRFWQIDRRRFLGIFQLIDEFLRLFPTARLGAAPDEFSRLGSSLNPLGTSAASMSGVLLFARRVVTGVDGQHMGLSTGSAGPAPQQALGGPVVRLLYD